MSKSSHFDDRVGVKMVDVSSKDETLRRAIAISKVRMSNDTLAAILEGRVAKGAVLETAKIAGINAAKHTWELIPLCHPIRISKVGVEIEPKMGYGLIIRAEVVAFDRTGVEMEALTAASVAALTVYDMCKSLERGILIEEVALLEKSGGRSGNWKANR